MTASSLENEPSGSVNVFDSPQSLRSLVLSLSEGTELRSLNRSVMLQDYGDNENLSDLVPNPSFRRLLTKEGEVIVGDSLYRITPAGTFYAHKSDKALLDSVVEHKLYDQFSRTNRDSLLTLNGRLFLFQTFGKEGFSEAAGGASSPLRQTARISFDDDPFEEDLSSAENDTPSQQNLKEDHERLLPSYEVKAMDRITFAGKAIEKIFGGKKDGKTTLQSNAKRRLSGSFYSYNYKVYSETGIEAKVEKKMWHGGWGKIKNWDEGTVIGLAGTIFQEQTEGISDKAILNYIHTWGKLAILGDARGEALEIGRSNFLLNPQDRFAFYSFISIEDVDYEQLEQLARRLELGYYSREANQELSFSLLKERYDTSCLGFTIDVIGAKKRYTYIKGSWSWQPGSQQVKIFDSKVFRIDFKRLVGGAAKVAAGIYKFVQNSGAQETGRHPGSVSYQTPSILTQGIGKLPANYANALQRLDIKPQAPEGDLKRLWKDIEEGAKEIAKSFEAAKPKVQVAGSTYCATQDGSQVTGMIMQKVRF